MYIGEHVRKVLFLHVTTDCKERTVLSCKDHEITFHWKSKNERYAHTRCRTSSSSTAGDRTTISGETAMVALPCATAIVVACACFLYCTYQRCSTASYCFDSAVFTGLDALLCALFRGLRVCPADETGKWPLALDRTRHYPRWCPALSRHGVALAPKFIARLLALPMGCAGNLAWLQSLCLCSLG